MSDDIVKSLRQELDWTRQELYDARKLLYLIIQKHGEIYIYDHDLAMVERMNCSIESIHDVANRRYVFRTGVDK